MYNYYKKRKWYQTITLAEVMVIITILGVITVVALPMLPQLGYTVKSAWPW